MSKEPSKAEILACADIIQTLLIHAASLIPHKVLIAKTAEGAEERTDLAMSMAPILGAFGQDYQEVHTKRKIEAMRANAILNLVEILEDTEKMRADMKMSSEAKARGRDQLRNILGD